MGAATSTRWVWSRTTPSRDGCRFSPQRTKVCWRCTSGLRRRRLLGAGHQRADLVAALAERQARRREELAFVYGSGPTSFERAIGWVARVALLVALTGVACAAGVISVPGLLEPLLPSIAIGGAATALL